MQNIVQLEYYGKFYYLQYYPTDSIQTIKEILVSNFHFEEKNLDIYWEDKLLSPKHVVIDIVQKDVSAILKIVGTEKIPDSPSNKEFNRKESQDENSKNPILRYRKMGFTEPDATISRLIQQNHGDVVKVLVDLLKNQKKTKQLALKQNRQ